jgi:fucose permease
MKKNAAVLIAFLSFVSLGIFDGMLGVAWPSMRGDFRVSLDAIGALLLPSVAAFTLGSFYSGALVRRLGLGKLLALAAALRALAIAGQGLSPVWGGVIAASVVGALGTAGIDAGLNTYMAHNHSARNMTWMHGFYGVGATLGPLVVTAVLVSGLSWRWSYAAAAIFQVVLLALFLSTQNAWGTVVVESEGAQTERGAPMRATLRLPVAWLGILLFFLYAGTEVSAGQWAFTLFTEERGIDLKTAGLWVGMYWGSFTVGRFIMGLIADRLRISTLLRASMLGMVLGLGLLWWDPSPAVSFLGLAFGGLSMAAVYPTLVTDTPRRLGRQHAPNAIGLQVGAAGLGVGLLSSGAGALGERFGLEAISLWLLIAAIALFVLYEVMRALVVKGKTSS